MESIYKLKNIIFLIVLFIGGSDGVFALQNALTGIVTDPTGAAVSAK